MKTTGCYRWVFSAFTAFLFIFNSMGRMPAYAEDGKFSGYMFGDYYWVASHHNPELKNRNGFQFRRIYFTYDKKLGDGWDIRFRPEFQSEGDFESKTKITGFMKDAYLRYTYGSHQIYFGLSPVPTFEVIEEFWGYRSVEPTPVDLYKYGPSRDFGLAAKGKLGASQRVYYHFMLANGSGTDNELNAGKKVMLAVGFTPFQVLTLEVYGDYEGRPDHGDRHTLQAFIGSRVKSAAMGVQYTRQTRQQGALPELNLDLISLFGSVNLSNKVRGLVRFDRQFDPNPDGASIDFLPIDPRSPANHLVAGLDFAPHKDVNLMPNVEIVTYDERNGITPDTDVLPRFTLFYRF